MKRLLCILIMVCLVLLSSMPALAATLEDFVGSSEEVGSTVNLPEVTKGDSSIASVSNVEGKKSNGDYNVKSVSDEPELVEVPDDVIDIRESINDSGVLDESQVSVDSRNAITNYMKNTSPVTEKNMELANRLASPLVSVIGTITGILLILLTAFVGLLSVVDLIYIFVPPLRPNLYAGGSNSGGGGNIGGRPGMMGGIGGHGMMGGSGNSGGFAGRQWVSDEVVQAVEEAATNGGGGGGRPGMMGGIGGPGMMGGMGPTQNNVPGNKRKSVIKVYLKRRAMCLVLLGVSAALLLNSFLMGVGLNVVKAILGWFN